MKQLAASFVALALCASSFVCAHAAESDPGSRKFSFAIIAGLPQSTREEPVAAAILRAVDASEARFTLDLGGVRGNSEPCSDELFEVRKTLLDGSQKPLVFVPGANDWANCTTPPAGRFDRSERLNRVRELFAPADQSLGQQRLALVRQSQMRRFHDYPENVRWQSGDVLFIGLNLPAPNGNYRFAAGRNSEFDERTLANRTWLEYGFRFARAHHCAAIVIFFEADPGFAQALHVPDPRDRSRDGFYEFKIVLREQVSHFAAPVLIVHSGVIGGPLDEPLTDSAGHVLKNNVVRLRSFGPPANQNWMEVKVDLDQAPVFSVAQHALASGETAPLDSAQ